MAPLYPASSFMNADDVSTYSVLSMHLHKKQDDRANMRTYGLVGPRRQAGQRSVDKKPVWCPYAVTTVYSHGLEFRPGSYPFTPVVQGSGVRVIGSRKFPIGKAAGRNAREPIGSLVKLR